MRCRRPREDEFEREIYATLQDGGCWRVINSKLGYSRCAAPRISYIPIQVYGTGNDDFSCANSLSVGGSVLNLFIVFDTRVGNTIDWCGPDWFFGVIARFVETESRVWRER